MVPSAVVTTSASKAAMKEAVDVSASTQLLAAFSLTCSMSVFPFAAASCDLHIASPRTNGNRQRIPQEKIFLRVLFLGCVVSANDPCPNFAPPPPLPKPPAPLPSPLHAPTPTPPQTPH